MGLMFLRYGEDHPPKIQSAHSGFPARTRVHSFCAASVTVTGPEDESRRREESFGLRVLYRNASALQDATRT
jgi:hypothetical protein